MQLRPANLSDREFLFQLRNDPGVIATSGTGRGVSEAEHFLWFGKATIENGQFLFIAESEVGAPIGQGRISLGEGGSAELSVSVIAPMRGLGYGKRIVEQLKEFSLAMNVKPFGRIHEDNIASIKCFERCGVEIRLLNGKP